MSPDWAGLLVPVLVIPPALGHLYHFIWLINVASSFGFREPLMDKMRALLFAGLLISSGLLLWMHLRAPWWTWGGLLWTYAIFCVVSGTVIWPLNSQLIVRRRGPPASRARQSRSTWPWPATTARRPWSGPARMLGCFASRATSRSGCSSVSGTSRSQTYPSRCGGLRIVQMSDLHVARCFDRRFFEDVVRACLEWPADLVVMTGDLVEDDETISWVEPLLSPLEARLGKFAILGNHDKEHQPRLITEEVRRAGFEILEGRWTTLDLEGTTLAIGGTSAPWGPAFAATDVPPADFRLLLSHSPDLFYKAQRWGIDLMLSGHNHGGQIRLPFVGPVFMPSHYSRRFDRGFFRQNGTLLYVNEGVGGKHPVRYGCPPEVSLLVLHAPTVPGELVGRSDGRSGSCEKLAPIEQTRVRLG